MFQKQKENLNAWKDAVRAPLVARCCWLGRICITLGLTATERGAAVQSRLRRWRVGDATGGVLFRQLSLC